MSESTDEQVAIEVQNGDADAFGVLIERYEAKMKRYARRFMSSSDDIEDVVQEVFIKAYTNLQSFDPERRFSPWLYRIAHNNFVNHLKKQQRLNTSWIDPDVIFPSLQSDETTDRAALEAELQTEMGATLEKLDPKYRAPLALFFYEELSYQEISEILKIPVTTVGVRISRAKAMVKQHYQPT